MIGSTVVAGEEWDGLFDFVKRCDLDKRFFGERRVAANGDLVEPPPQMGPAEGQDQRLRSRRSAKCR